MKFLTLLLSVSIFIFSCNCTKKATTETKVFTETKQEKEVLQEKQVNTNSYEYTANTRGFYRKITIQDQIATISNDRNGVQKPTVLKLSDADWNELQGYFKSIDLEKLASYNAPTEKRFYDGAAIANLKVVCMKKEYNSVSFDHGFPPVAIEKFVNKMNSFAKVE